jgi:tetratricopeptide (TPR) repeat protein
MGKIWDWFGSWVKHDGLPETNNASRKSLLTQLAAIEGLTNRVFVTIIVVIAIYSIANANVPACSATQGLISFACYIGETGKIFGVLLGVLIASAVLGGFLGFLFGIPRLLQHSPNPGSTPSAADGSKPGVKPKKSEAAENERASRRFLSSNTNLEEISDWITKIIVGLSLVQAGFIFEKIKRAAVVFKTNALPHAVGADIIFVLIMVAAAIAGFLFFYMETRTRITLMFGDLENAADDVDRIVAQKELNAVLDAPITATRGAAGTGDGSTIAAPPDPIEEDKKILQTNYNDLNKPEELAAWASAQARANNFQAAIRALNDAISLRPDDKNLLVRLADVQQRQGNPRGAYYSITEARQKSNDDPDLIKREMLASLYLSPPDGFRKALAAAEKLRASGAAEQDAWVQLWTACAHGQRYKWLTETNGSDANKADARDSALAAVREVVRLDPKRDSSLRVFLRSLLQPGPNSTDDDLGVFGADSAFKQAADA